MVNQILSSGRLLGCLLRQLALNRQHYCLNGGWHCITCDFPIKIELCSILLKTAYQTGMEWTGPVPDFWPAFCFYVVLTQIVFPGNALEV